MANESKDIRFLMEDINDIIEKTSLNESYVFGQKPTQQAPVRRQMPTEEEEPTLNDEPELSNDEPELKDNSQPTDITGKISKIRSVAIHLLADLNPMNDPEAYKLVKSIWDSCDKFLLKGNESPKPQEENNNI